MAGAFRAWQTATPGTAEILAADKETANLVGHWSCGILPSTAITGRRKNLSLPKNSVRGDRLSICVQNLRKMSPGNLFEAVVPSQNSQ